MNITEANAAAQLLRALGTYDAVDPMLVAAAATHLAERVHKALNAGPRISEQTVVAAVQRLRGAP